MINGVVVGRNAGHGRAIYDFARPGAGFRNERFNVDLRAEAFNVFNHANFVGYSGTYGNGATAGAGFGARWSASPPSCRPGRCSSRSS